VFQITFEDQDTHDMFTVDLNGWAAIDNKLDGWVEAPVPWPAIILPQGNIRNCGSFSSIILGVLIVPKNGILIYHWSIVIPR